MQNVIEIDEISERLRAVVRDVAARRVPYALAENGRPEAAIVPIEDFRRLTEPDLNPQRVRCVSIGYGMERR